MSWKLDTFEIKKPYTKDHYEGEIRFRNSDYEIFKLKIDKRQTADILKLLKPDIAFKARELCDQLIEELEEQILKR